MMDFAGILGGYLAEVAVSGMSWQLYFERSFALHLVLGSDSRRRSRPWCSASSLPIAASYLGFTTSRGTEGVGEASTRSVVLASMPIILVDVILVRMIFFFYPQVGRHDRPLGPP